MPQPIRKTKQSTASKEKPFNTLLIDGSSLLEMSFYADTTLNSRGERVGGIQTFLHQMSKLMELKTYRYVYVFWDGAKSGQLRYELNSDYKANRDKTFDNNELSDYMKEYEARLQGMRRKLFKPQKSEDEKAQFYHQREVLMNCLEELFVRQCVNDIVEADDFIAYYIINKLPHEHITIASTDRDLTQLIDTDVDVMVFGKSKMLLTHETHLKYMGYTHENVLVKKIICGDVSDNIKGISNVGIATLTKYIPEISTQKMELNEVLDRAKEINDKRISEGKKPYKWAENMLNRVTTGAPGKYIYEINERIINLRKPLMTEEAIENIDAFRYTPLDPEGRSIQNVYAIIKENGIETLYKESFFAVFMREFAKHIETEKLLNK